MNADPYRDPAARPRWRLAAIAAAGATAVAGGIALIGFGIMWLWVARQLPRPEDLTARALPFQTTHLYDRQGQLLAEAFDADAGRRSPVAIADVARVAVSATIATEDANFYRHGGVDPVAVARALWYAVRERRVVSGASTIPQQLVKRVLLTPERTIRRKVKEVILATELSRRYPKDTILELYLNEIFYGNFAYGIRAASETYFGVMPAQLSLDQAALLAGLPQAPAYYDPYVSPDRALERRATVLDLMVKDGAISRGDADLAAATPLDLQPPPAVTMRAPHFTLYARERLEALYGPEALTSMGLEVVTTLDGALQTAAEDIVRQAVAELVDQEAHNGAVVAIDPRTGEVLALVGSADFGSAEIDGQVNLALAPRQPGSTMKPMAYLAAFEGAGGARWTPETLVADITATFPDGTAEGYTPVNYDRTEHGLVTVRAALANSYNIPAVRTNAHIGVPALLASARRLGVTTLDGDGYGLSLVLGSGEVPLLEMTGAYAVLAAGGIRRQPSVIRKVSDAAGKVLCEMGTDTPCLPDDGTKPAERVAKATDAYLITDILADGEARIPAFGRGSFLELGRPAAVKTGTTNDYRDSLTIGYTPEIVVGAWVGNADRTPMLQVAGSIGAARIWNRVMHVAVDALPVSAFDVPDGIVTHMVCADTGTLPSQACPEQRNRVFSSESPPLGAEHDLWQRVAVERDSGLRAGERTPQCLVEERAFKVFPPELTAWAEAHAIPQPPTEVSALLDRPSVVQIAWPLDGASTTGLVTLTGTVDMPALADYAVWYADADAPDVFFGPLAGPFPRSIGGGTLAGVDMRDLPSGRYILKVAAKDACGTEASARIRVMLDVPTPTITPTATVTATPSPTGTALPTPTLQRFTATPVPTRPTDVPPTLVPRPTVGTESTAQPSATVPSIPTPTFAPAPGEPTLAPRPTDPPQGP